MHDPVSREEKGRWFTELTTLQESIATQVMGRMLGKTLKVYVSGAGRCGEGWVSGRSDENLLVEFPADKDVIGTFQMVRVTEAQTYILKGERVACEA